MLTSRQLQIALNGRIKAIIEYCKTHGSYDLSNDIKRYKARITHPESISQAPTDPDTLEAIRELNEIFLREATPPADTEPYIL